MCETISGEVADARGHTVDRRVLLGGMKLARRLLKSKPLEPYYLREELPGPNVQSDDELLDLAKNLATTTFHPGGSCRMGPASDPTTVVDDQLRVHGIEGLRVADASIMPTMLSANLNAATMMIATARVLLATRMQALRLRSTQTC